MAYLLDTNVLLRIRHAAAPEYPAVRNALRVLVARNERLYFTSQNLAEFWNVSTRPATARGGFGLGIGETDRRMRLLERIGTLITDSAVIHQEWRRLVVAHSVIGVQVHDARLVAAMRVHGIGNILTLNTRDFARYPSVSAIEPNAIR